MTKPTPRVEVAFAADPLDATYAKGVMADVTDSTFTTPSTSAKVLGDIDITARVALTDWTPAGEQAICGRWFPAFGVAGYLLTVTTTGQLKLYTSADGSTEISQASTAGSWINGTSYWVRATLDVDNGASGKTYSFYWAADSEVEPLRWTLLSSHTVAGTTSLFDTTMTFEVGSYINAFFRLIGDVHRVIVRSGIGGTVVADFDPYDALTPTSSTWGSSRVAGQVWTRGAGASLSVAPVWTDITAYVRDLPVSIGRGKQSEIPTYASSSLSLTLNNRDRRFDPEYTSGAYYPNVKPRKRIRVRGTYDSTTHTLFTGYVESWPQQYPNANFDATVELTAYDSLGLLNDTVLDDAAFVYARDTIGNLGSAYRTRSDRQWLDAITGKAVYRRSGFVSDGEPMGVGPGSPVEFTGTGRFSFATFGASDGIQTNTSGGWSFWVRTTTAGASATELRMIIQSTDQFLTTKNTTRIGINSSGRIVVDHPGTFTLNTVSDTKVTDGSPHHVVVMLVSEGGAAFYRIWIDGQDSTGTYSNAPDPGYDNANVGAITFIGGTDGSVLGDLNFVGTLQDVYGFRESLTVTSAQVITFQRLAAGALPESTGARASRLLTVVGVPAGLTAISDATSGTVAEINTYEQSALSELQLVADSESGAAVLFVDSRGRVALHDRFWWQSSPRGNTVQATFSDDLADLNYMDVTADRNLREVQNRINVTGSAETTYTASDSASITAYGARSASLTTILSTQVQVTSLATGLLALRKDPTTRLDAITVRPAFQPTAWPSVLRLDLGDRIVFELMPARGVTSTSQLVRTLIVERLDWVFTQDDWSLQITGSPIPTQTIFTLDQSLLDGSDVLGF